MILLDTNAVYWVMTGDPRLGTNALTLLTRRAQRYVSSITHVEFAIKEMTGKIHLPPDLPKRLEGIGLEALPFTDKHADGLRLFPTLVKHDPFDRMLLAQARVDGLDLLTSDRVLLALGEPWIIDATQ